RGLGANTVSFSRDQTWSRSIAMEDRFMFLRSLLPAKEILAGGTPAPLSGPGRLFFGSCLALAEADGFADTVAEVVELGAARNAAPLDLDLRDFRRVQRELPLDALAGDDAADGEHLAAAAARAGDDGAGEDLNALILAFEDASVHIDGVANGKLWHFGLEARFFDEFQNLLAHWIGPFSVSLCKSINYVFSEVGFVSSRRSARRLRVLR